MREGFGLFNPKHKPETTLDVDLCNFTNTRWSCTPDVMRPESVEVSFLEKSDGNLSSFDATKSTARIRRINVNFREL